jgi:hypothetical protein
MKMMLVAGGLITMPAIAVAVIFFGSTLMIPALISLFINLIPFVVAGYLLRDAGSEDMSH